MLKTFHVPKQTFVLQNFKEQFAKTVFRTIFENSYQTGPKFFVDYLWNFRCLGRLQLVTGLILAFQKFGIGVQKM